MGPKTHKGLLVVCVLLAVAMMAMVGTNVASAEARPHNTQHSTKYKIKLFKQQLRKSESIIRFWEDRERGRWALHLRHEKCWQVHGKLRRKLCAKARGSLREHTAMHAEAKRKLEHLAIYALPIGNYDHWICIHKGEGAWNASTGNGYYGGLQMNMGFQRFYGSEFLAKYGTADNWPPRVQMAVAQRAYDGYRGERARGYGPWPNTARDCGLL